MGPRIPHTSCRSSSLTGASAHAAFFFKISGFAVPTKVVWIFGFRRQNCRASLARSSPRSRQYLAAWLQSSSTTAGAGCQVQRRGS